MKRKREVRGRKKLCGDVYRDAFESIEQLSDAARKRAIALQSQENAFFASLGDLQRAVQNIPVEAKSTDPDDQFAQRVAARVRQKVQTRIEGILERAQGAFKRGRLSRYASMNWNFTMVISDMGEFTEPSLELLDQLELPLGSTAALHCLALLINKDAKSIEAEVREAPDEPKTDMVEASLYAQDMALNKMRTLIDATLQSGTLEPERWQTFRTIVADATAAHNNLAALVEQGNVPSDAVATLRENFRRCKLELSK